MKINTIEKKLITGTYLKELRKQHKMPRRILAEMLDIHLNSIVKWENGLSTPNDEHKILLAHIFNKSVEEIFYQNY